MKGTLSGYDIELEYASNYTDGNTCPDCGRLISNGHDRCRACARIYRRLENVTIPDAKYLNAVPDGYELIWYPFMARSWRGERNVRRHLRRRLRRYFARRKETPEQPPQPKRDLAQLERRADAITHDLIWTPVLRAERWIRKERGK